MLYPSLLQVTATALPIDALNALKQHALADNINILLDASFDPDAYAAAAASHLSALLARSSDAFLDTGLSYAQLADVIDSIPASFAQPLPKSNSNSNSNFEELQSQGFYYEEPRGSATATAITFGSVMIGEAEAAEEMQGGFLPMNGLGRRGQTDRRAKGWYTND